MSDHGLGPLHRDVYTSMYLLPMALDCKETDKMKKFMAMLIVCCCSFVALASAQQPQGFDNLIFVHRSVGAYMLRVSGLPGYSSGQNLTRCFQQEGFSFHDVNGNIPGNAYGIPKYHTDPDHFSNWFNFSNRNPSAKLLNDHEVIVLKSCYSAVLNTREPMHFKPYYQNLLEKLLNYSDRIFIICTAPPLNNGGSGHGPIPWRQRNLWYRKTADWLVSEAKKPPYSNIFIYDMNRDIADNQYDSSDDDYGLHPDYKMNNRAPKPNTSGYRVISSGLIKAVVNAVAEYTNH